MLTALQVKLLSIYLFAQNLFCGCRPEERTQDFDWPRSGFKAHKVFRLPDVVDECSGAVAWTDSTFLTHNDDGEEVLYEIDYAGRLVRTLPVPGSENFDWEDITRSPDGTVYVSDLGNNLNMRRKLALYRYRPGRDNVAGRIGIRYQDQAEFPPPPEQQNFDCEAVFYWRDSLYAVSKNRGRKTVKVYAVPTTPGDHVVAPVDSARLFHLVTGADVSPDGSMLALCAYGMVYLFKLEPGKPILSQPRACLRFSRSGQAEAVWWRDQHRFYVANEAQKVFLFERKDGAEIK